MFTTTSVFTNGSLLFCSFSGHQLLWLKINWSFCNLTHSRMTGTVTLLTMNEDVGQWIRSIFLYLSMSNLGCFKRNKRLPSQKQPILFLNGEVIWQMTLHYLKTSVVGTFNASLSNCEKIQRTMNRIFVPALDFKFVNCLKDNCRQQFEGLQFDICVI